jgi:hypothetical protein
MHIRVPHNSFIFVYRGSIDVDGGSVVANAGFGLFATMNFKKKEEFSKLVGAPSNYYEHAKYLMPMCGDNYLDCAMERYAANTLHRRNNCTISHSRRFKLL